MLSGDHFFLNSDCLLVSGAVNAAIYHLSTGDVYSIDGVGRQIVEMCEWGMPLSSIYPLMPKVEDKAEIIKYLQRLETLRLGNSTQNPVPPQKVQIQPPPYALAKIWLELTSSCNLRCVHCYADSLPRKDNCSLSLHKWQAVISEAASLGARWVQFIGGEPLLYGKRNLCQLILTARKARFGLIEVFTNGTLIDDEYVGFFAEHGVHIALSIYSKRPEIHDKVTESPGSFHRMMKNIEKLRHHGVPLRFGLVVMKQNLHYEEETLEWIRTWFGDVHVSSDIIRGTVGGRDRQMALLTPELWGRKLRTEPDFVKVTMDSFTRNKFGHSCLTGGICVQADGAVYPCIMDRTQPLGTVTESNLTDVVEGRATRAIWGLSKEQLPVCCDCEYRYACPDCRPLAVAMAEATGQPHQGLLAKDPCCLYDPYKGEWGDAGEFMDTVAKREPLTTRQESPRQECCYWSSPSSRPQYSEINRAATDVKGGL
jgi:radical SAM protein with 4Fe4S-binding SPASM domain